MNKGTELKGILGHVNKNMERELEGLERLAMPDELHDEECKKAGVELTEDYDLIKEALLELKSIKEAKSSDAMECIKRMWDDIDVYNDFRQDFKGLKIIENYILKAQEQEKASEILFSKKYIPLDKLNPKWWVSKEVYDECVNYKMYLFWCKNYEVVLKPEQILNEEEFDTLKEYAKYEYERQRISE